MGRSTRALTAPESCWPEQRSQPVLSRDSGRFLRPSEMKKCWLQSCGGLAQAWGLRLVEAGGSTGVTQLGPDRLLALLSLVMGHSRPHVGPLFVQCGVSRLGATLLLFREYLTTSGDIFGCHNWGVPLASCGLRPSMCLPHTSYMHRAIPHNQELFVPKHQQG